MKKIILFISIVFCFSCEEEDVIEQNLLEFLIGKVYEAQSDSDYWGIDLSGDGKLYVQFFEDVNYFDNDTIALGWNFYNIPVNDNNCSLGNLLIGPKISHYFNKLCTFNPISVGESAIVTPAFLSASIFSDASADLPVTIAPA